MKRFAPFLASSHLKPLKLFTQGYKDDIPFSTRESLGEGREEKWRLNLIPLQYFLTAISAITL